MSVKIFFMYHACDAVGLIGVIRHYSFSFEYVLLFTSCMMLTRYCVFQFVYAVGLRGVIPIYRFGFECGIG